MIPNRLEDLIYLLMDLGIIDDFHISGIKLVGVRIKDVDYGDMSYDFFTS